MEKERLEQKIGLDILRTFNMDVSYDEAAKLTYEICYLRLLSVRTFKNITGHDYLSLEDFIDKYSKSLKDIEDEIIYNQKNDIEVSFGNIQLCLELAQEVLYDMEKYKFSIKNIFRVMSILCSYNGMIIKNVMSLDLLDNSRFRTQTPNQICKIINYLLDSNKNDDVLDICSAYGNYLINVNNCCEYKSLSGIEISNELSLISKIRLISLSVNFEIINDNVFNLPLNKKYDKVFCNYPFGIRYQKHELDFVLDKMKEMKFNWEKISPSSSDWVFIDTLLTYMKNDGKGATIMTGGPLFKINDEQYRRDIVNSGMVEAVIKLPTITNYTSVDQYLVLFSNNNKTVKFIDISSFAERVSFNSYDINMSKIFEILSSKNSKYINEVSVSEVEKNSFVLTVDNYVGKKEINYVNPKKLSDFVVDVFRGYQMSSKEQKELQDENGEFEVLTISDINDGKIANSLTRIRSEEKKYDRYLIKKDDLIISSKGTRIKIAVVDNIDDRKIIANGNLIVLRLDTTKINPHYLEMYLNSSDGQTILNQIQTGSIIISINPSRLIDITISTLPIDKQHQLAKKYKMIKTELSIAREHVKKLELEQSNFFDDEVMELFDNE